MALLKFIPIFSVLIFLTGCATTRTYTYSVDGTETICGKNNINLGQVVILPEAAWRKDQKEPELREQMVLEEINDAFNVFSCGNISLPGGVKSFKNWSAIPQQKLLQQFSSENIQSLIILRIEELTPRLDVTFSIPFLWGGSSEADFRIRVISVKTGNVITDMRIKRATGGPFNVRPAEWARDELNAALRSVM
jgi:hypothetical protein